MTRPVVLGRAVSAGRLGPRHAVAVAVVVAAVSAGAFAGRQPLSWDEAVTVSAARHPVGPLLGMLRHTDAPLGAYYLFMHGWLRLAAALGLRADETWLRLPSAAGAVAAVALATVLAHRMTRRVPVALAAGLLLAVHPMLVFYARDARPYALATAVAVGATLLFLRALADPAPGRLAAWAALGTLGVYLHLFTALVLVAHLVVALVRGGRRWSWLAAGGAVALCAAPLLAVAAGETGELAWIPTASPLAAVGVVGKLAGGVFVLLPAAAAALFAVARPAELPGEWRTVGRLPDRQEVGPVGRPPDRRAARTVGWLLVCWGCLPPALLIAADTVRPVLVARYLLPAVPALAIGLAVLAWRGGRMARVLVAVTVAVAAVVSLVQQAGRYKYEDYRAAARAVTVAARPGDGVVFLPVSARVGLEQYLVRRRRGALPADLALRPGQPPDRSERIGGRERPPAIIADRIDDTDRVFLVGVGLPQAVHDHHARSDQAKEVALSDGYRSCWRRAFGQVTVTLFERDATTPQGVRRTSG